MAKYVFNQKEYEDWIKQSEEYNKLPLDSYLRTKSGLESSEAKAIFRPLYAKFLKQKYGADGDAAVAEFKKAKPFTEPISETTAEPTTVSEETVTTPTTKETITEKVTPATTRATTTREVDPYAKFLRGSDYKEKRLLSDLASSKAYKGQALAGAGLAGVDLLTGLGQMIAGRKKAKGLTPPKYPAEMLPNQQLASRLAQAQVEAQMADPVIREKLLSDLASQKMVADEIARATSGGDISAYAGLSQANAGNISKALRDIAVQEGVDKLRKQQVLDQLIGAKMGEERQTYQDKLAKFTGVDYPEFQAQREYAAGLSNKGLENILSSIKSGTELTAPVVQSKSIQQGMIGQLQGLSPEKQAELAKKYPALKKYLTTPTPSSVAPAATTTATQATETPSWLPSYLTNITQKYQPTQNLFSPVTIPYKRTTPQAQTNLQELLTTPQFPYKRKPVETPWYWQPTSAF